MNDMKIFEVLYAFENDSSDNWSKRIYLLAANIGDAWTKARTLFVGDQRIASLREMPKGRVVEA